MFLNNYMDTCVFEDIEHKGHSELWNDQRRSGEKTLIAPLKMILAKSLTLAWTLH